jgi:hypothetical protein
MGVLVLGMAQQGAQVRLAPALPLAYALWLAQLCQQQKNVSSPGGAKGRLPACNRLLLGTFLSYADRVGLVDNLGTSDLIALTELDEESLSHRKRRLIKLGLMQGCIPGSSDAIFSSKPVTVYFISLSAILDILFLKYEIKACIYVFDRLLFGKVKKYPETFDEGASSIY